MIFLEQNKPVVEEPVLAFGRIKTRLLPAGLTKEEFEFMVASPFRE